MSDGVGAERMARAGGQVDAGKVGTGLVGVIHQRAGETEQHEQQHHRQPGEGEAVAAEPAPGEEGAALGDGSGLDDSGGQQRGHGGPQTRVFTRGSITVCSTSATSVPTTVASADDQDAAEQDGEVRGLRGVPEQQSHAGVVEQLLDDERAAEQHRHVVAEHRDDGRQRVAQDVAGQHGAGRCAPGAGGAHVVLVEVLQCGRPHEPAEHGDHGGRPGDDGQHQPRGISEHLGQRVP